MPEPNDERFEIYLRSFRPVEPEPLPLRVEKRAVGAQHRSALAAIAIACLSAAALTVIVLPRSPQSTNETVPKQTSSDVSSKPAKTETSMPALTRLALDDHAAFVEFMTDKAESQFPRMTNEQSALRVLAKQ
ncbi:MAG: hypothetical protein JO119_09465 [Acidobacteria bacterium]|nr:hypothetical protein [Acidobacteriota bacterium]